MKDSERERGRERERGAEGSPAPPRYMSPLVKQDLARLDKDGESRRSAMNSLKHFVENLDPGSMPRFLAQVSESRDQGASRSYAISLYEEVARVHGRLIIPHIPRVMGTVLRSLSSSGSSPQLHQACAKVVTAVARHAIEGGGDSSNPASAHAQQAGQTAGQAGEILRELCNPLHGVLAGTLEPQAAGAAVCLQALVESEEWRYASDEVVKETCLKTTMALGEKTTRTVAHIQLARALACTNPTFFNTYGVALLRTGSEILCQSPSSATWQQRACAARLLQAVLHTVDKPTLNSELEHIVQALDDCKHDRMAGVRTAVGGALKTAKMLSACPQDSATSGVSFDGEDSFPDIPNLSFQDDDDDDIRSISKSPSEGRGPFLVRASDDMSISGRSKQSGSLSEEDSALFLFPCSSPGSSSISTQESPEKNWLSCDSGPLPGVSPQSAHAKGGGKRTRSRPRAGATGPHAGRPPLPGDKVGADQQSRDREPSSLVMSKGRGGGRTYSSLESSVITVNDKQKGAGILADDEDFSSNSNSVDVGVDSRLPFPSKYDNHRENRGTSFDMLSGSTTFTQAQGQRVPAGPARKNLFDVQGNAVHRTSPSACSPRLDDDDGFRDSFASHDRNKSSEPSCNQQSRVLHSPPPREESFEDDSSPQKQRALITADDFLPFSTPRRLVRSLQSSSPASADARKDQNVSRWREEAPDMELETCSEAAWSVRENPMASDDSFKADSEEENQEKEKVKEEKEKHRENRDQQAREHKVDHTTSTIGTRDNNPAAEDLLGGTRLSSDCERISCALIHAAESLFCATTSMTLESESSASRDAEVPNGKLVRKSSDFCCAAAAHSRGGLRSLIRDDHHHLSGCCCGSQASASRKGSPERVGQPLRYRSEQEEGQQQLQLEKSSNDLQREGTVGVLRIRFRRSLKDTCLKSLRNVEAYMEVFLGAFLLVALALPLAMIISKFVWPSLDTPELVPT